MNTFTPTALTNVIKPSGRVVPKAFTLIELLVVISIIGLLMAILLPALQSAREQGQFTASISNIRQIQIGLLNYTGDAKDVLPWGRNSTSTQYWPAVMVVNGYCDNPFIYWGPMRDTRFLDTNFVGPDSWRFLLKNPAGSNGLAYAFSGYGVNSQGCMPWWNDGLPQRSLSSGSGFVQPSKLLFIGEQFNQDNVVRYSEAQGWKDGTWYLGNSNNANNYAQIYFTWRGQAARGYLDGSARGGSSLDLGFSAIDPRNGSFISPYFGYNPGSKNEPYYNLDFPINR
jgi:prepilin-type N-terminal cleavage/methylation domain-containing protein